MMGDLTMIPALYRKLVGLYPREFRERLGESMQQTFHDLWNEKRQTRKGLWGFVIWTFIETLLGIVREHLLSIGEGAGMQSIFKTTGLSMLMSFLLILPLMIMEVVNRRTLNEEFPMMLFFIMGLNLFAISLILMPILRSKRTGSHDTAQPVFTQGNTLLTNPTSAAILSIVLILLPFVFAWLDSLSWLPLDLDRLFNGPNPEVAYSPGQMLALSLFALPIAAGVIAGGPIVRSLRAGGSLFAHPIHMIIVAIIVLPMAFGLVSLIIDQWPCFMGVPNCD